MLISFKIQCAAHTSTEPKKKWKKKWFCFVRDYLNWIQLPLFCILLYSLICIEYVLNETELRIDDWKPSLHNHCKKSIFHRISLQNSQFIHSIEADYFFTHRTNLQWIFRWQETLDMNTITQKSIFRCGFFDDQFLVYLSKYKIEVNSLK